jgi:hydroxyacylglutathione hydrolase
MRIQGFTTGMFQSNCYVIADPETQEAFLVDPGQDAAEPLMSAVTEASFEVRAVLLTHGHIDHVWSAAEVADQLDVDCFLHPMDRWLLENPGKGIGSDSDPWKLDMPKRLADLDDGQLFKTTNLQLTAKHSPGHTPGHCIFIAQGVIVSGDLIFAGSVGRTDFPRGSTEQLLDSINRLVLTEPDDTLIVSGHGPSTTVGDERRSNPFVNMIGEAPQRRGL